MGCLTNPVVATAMGVAVGLAIFMAGLGLAGLVSLVLSARLPPRYSASSAPVVPRPVATPSRCACGRTARNGSTQCGPCQRGERHVGCIGGEPVGGA